MKSDVGKVKKTFLKDLQDIKNERDLEKVRVRYLGRKSLVAALMKKMSSLSVAEKKSAGKILNVLKKEITEDLKNKKSEIDGVKINGAQDEAIDVTAPGSEYAEGHLHPVTKVYDEIFEIFKRLSFSIVEGPDVESDWYNFVSLNFPKYHPARDTQDTFFVNEEVLLRTHTSPAQIRYVEKNQPPIRIVSPGRTYRKDSDATHSPMFHQLEGVVIDKNITFADLKGTLEYFAKAYFGEDRKLRFRPHYFPFTEPSVEIDIICGICKGKGCRSCKYSGWLEILGAGMMHPDVLRNGGIDPEEFTGFAFGVGIERMAMLKYNINDLRLFYDGDLRFNKQF